MITNVVVKAWNNKDPRDFDVNYQFSRKYIYAIDTILRNTDGGKIEVSVAEVNATSASMAASLRLSAKLKEQGFAVMTNSIGGVWVTL